MLSEIPLSRILPRLLYAGSFLVSAVVVSLIFLTVNAAEIDNRPVYRVASVQNPPFIIVNKNAPPTGIISDIFLATLNHNKLRYAIEQYPVMRFYRLVLAEKIDIYIFPKSLPPFDKVMYCGDQLVTEFKLNIYSLNENKIQQISDIANQRVIVLHGYQYFSLQRVAPNAFESAKKIPMKNTANAIKALQVGRGDFLLAYQFHVDAHKKKLRFRDFITFNVSRNSYYFCVRKTLDNARPLLQQLDKTVRAFTKNGLIDKIHQQYSIQE